MRNPRCPVCILSDRHRSPDSGEKGLAHQPDPSTQVRIDKSSTIFVAQPTSRLESQRHRNVTDPVSPTARVSGPPPGARASSEVAWLGGDLLDHPLLEASVAKPPGPGRSALRPAHPRNDSGRELVRPTACRGSVRPPR